nr:unnamed protein product [Spirometra erinaceieuropaei]
MSGQMRRDNKSPIWKDVCKNKWQRLVPGLLLVSLVTICGGESGKCDLLFLATESEYRRSKYHHICVLTVYFDKV